jgi:hypothetical protein
MYKIESPKLSSIFLIYVGFVWNPGNTVDLAILLKNCRGDTVWVSSSSIIDGIFLEANKNRFCLGYC